MYEFEFRIKGGVKYMKSEERERERELLHEKVNANKDSEDGIPFLLFFMVSSFKNNVYKI